MNKLNIEVTTSALEMIKKALPAEGEEAQVIRVMARRAGGIRFQYQIGLEPESRILEDDSVYESEGVVIRADPSSAECLQDVKLDYVDGEDGAGFKFHNPIEEKGWEDPIAQQFQELLDTEINPGIASHGGYINLVDYKDGKAYVEMGGGCQGCGMAHVTLREGVEVRVRELIPEIKEIIDTTNHSHGGPCSG